MVLVLTPNSYLNEELKTIGVHRIQFFIYTNTTWYIIIEENQAKLNLTGILNLD
jgi:hypothetical protein